MITLGLSIQANQVIAAGVPEVVTAPDTTAAVKKEAVDTLQQDYKELDEVVVVQSRKLVESDGAKTTYNVTEDPESGSSNILDILRKVPGVSVDAEDNVRVNGQTSFKILMNGREDPMLKGDIKTILKSLPAASIKKIEVISEPGAKYEAEGTAGILNIVTDKSRNLNGFMTQLQGWVNAYQTGGNLNGRTKVGNVMLDANISYNNGNVWPRSYRYDRETENQTDDLNHLEVLNRKGCSGWDYTGGRLSMSWEPDTLNLFTLSANIGYNTWASQTHDLRTMFDSTRNPFWQLDRDTRSAGHYLGSGVQASYQHTFGKDGHFIVGSYEFDLASIHHFNDYILNWQTGLPGEIPFSSNHARTGNHEHIFQLDYANPFSPHHLLEAGAKMSLSDSRSENEPWFGSDAADAVPDASQALDVSQFKNIYSAYASYTGNYDKWSVKAGIRYEHTDMGLRYKTPGHKDFTTVLNDVVPNLAASYNFESSASLRLAYQMRIMRPGLETLNPYVNDLTPGWITYGNPDLKSVKSHNVSLSYSNFAGKFGGMAKIGYTYISNDISDIIFTDGALINSTYANIGRDQTVSLEVNTNWNITPMLRWSVYVGGCYQDIRADSEMLKARKSGWQGNFNTDISYTMPCKVRLSLYGGGNTPWIDIQSRGSMNYFYGLGVSRSFLKDEALSVSLNASNLFPAVYKYGYTQTDETVRLRQTIYSKRWNVGLSVSWKFGGLKSNVRKTSAVIEKEASAGAGGEKGK